MTYTLWGLPQGETDRLHERVLLSDADSQRCDQIEKLATADGWHGFRRTPNDGAMPDFVGAIRGTKRKRAKP